MELVSAFPFKSGKVYYAGWTERIGMLELVSNSFFVDQGGQIAPTKIELSPPRFLTFRRLWYLG